MCVDLAGYFTSDLIVLGVYENLLCYELSSLPFTLIIFICAATQHVIKYVFLFVCLSHPPWQNKLNLTNIPPCITSIQI